MIKVLDSAVPIACWSCSIGHNDSTLFCPHCSKIQPPPGGDFFQVFSLERQFNVDLPALEHEFHRLSRKVHPDRFARADENERQWSLADTALLNDAYRTLKDPSRVPADLLEEVFELNMQLEEMRMARKMGEEDPQLLSDLVQAKKKFESLLGAVDEDLHAQWNVWDVGDAAKRQAAQKTMVAQLDRRRYLSNLVRDVNEVLGA